MVFTASQTLRDEVQFCSSTSLYKADYDLNLLREKFWAIVSAVPLTNSFLLSIIYHEICFWKDSDNLILAQQNYHLILWLAMAVSNVLASLTLYLRRRSSFEAYKKFEGRRWILSQSLRKLLLELAVVWILPLHWSEGFVLLDTSSNYGGETFYNFNNILTFLMILRVAIITDILVKNSRYSSLQMKRLMDCYNKDVDFIFVIKCMIRTQPYRFLIITLVGSLLLFSYAIRVFELPNAVLTGNLVFKNFFETAWMVLITVTTVGYGDNTPKTLIGRFLCFVMCLWGTFLLSLIVIILFDSLALNIEEQQVLKVFNKLEARKSLMLSLSKFVHGFWRLKKGLIKPDAFNHLKKEFHFKRIAFELSNDARSDYFYERVSTYLEKMARNIDGLQRLKEEEHRLSEQILYSIFAGEILPPFSTNKNYRPRNKKS